jgi:hypothetical protein
MTLWVSLSSSTSFGADENHFERRKTDHPILDKKLWKSNPARAIALAGRIVVRQKINQF